MFQALRRLRGRLQGFRAVPAGLVDSGFASLATFVFGLYAANTWQDENTTLGVYALFMSAFVFAANVPSQLWFVPAEKATLLLRRSRRAELLPRMLKLGIRTSAGSASLAMLAAVVGWWQGFPTSLMVPLSVTAVATSFVSPIQDHVRRVLHLTERSWLAASVSAIQFGGALAALFGMRAAGIETVWIPLGGLALANTLSLTSGIIMSRSVVRSLASPTDEDRAKLDTATRRLTYRHVFEAGRWLLTTGVVSTGTNFLVASIVTALAGSEALGLAEAARTVGQPMLVLAFGLRSVLGPQSMEAARGRDRGEARRVARVFLVLTVAAGAAYLLLVGFDTPWNPMAILVPNAYLVGGLVIATIIGNAFNSLMFPGRMELIGANREVDLWRVEMVSNAGQASTATVVAALGSGSLTVGAYARPLAFGVLGLVRLGGFRRVLNRHYGA